jgi:hypothetical protein
MRFVRVFVRADTGQVLLAMEQETPFDTHGFAIEGAAFAIEQHDLGLAEDFEPTDLISGKPCSPSRHLFQRIERNPDAPAESKGLARFRAKAGHELPAFHDVPTTMDGIKELLRAKGPGAIPERVAHWLEYMGAISSDGMDAAGLPRLTAARAMEFDAMRQARDPHAGSRLGTFKRRIRERAAMRAARRAAGREPPA